MKIDLLTENTLKLTLSGKDAYELGIDFEKISKKDSRYTLAEKQEATKKLMSYIEKSIKDEPENSSIRNFKKLKGGENILVEAFSRPSGGFLLYISRLDKMMEETSDISFDILRPDLQFPFIDNLLKKSHFENLKAKILYRTVESDSKDNLFSVLPALYSLPVFGDIIKTAIISEYQAFGKFRVCFVIQDINSSLSDFDAFLSEFGTVFSDESDYLITKEYFSECRI